MEITLEKLTRDVIGKRVSATDTWYGDYTSFEIEEVAFKLNGMVRIMPKDKSESLAFHTFIELKREIFEKLIENKNAVDSTMIDGCLVQKMYELK